MRIALYCGLLIVCSGVCAYSAASAPEWAQELSSRALPAYPPEVNSVVLLDESHTTLSTTGERDIQLRKAMRVVTIEGRADAFAGIEYLQGAGKVKDFHAWLISPSGFVKSYGKESLADVALKESFALYEDYRMRLIEARNPEVGATFAWSAELVEPALVPQDEWYFQEREPVLLSRCIWTLPPGWSAKATTFNHVPVTPLIDGSTYTWQLENLPVIEKEPASPRLGSLAPGVGITLFPPSASSILPAMGTWSDLSSWMTQLVDNRSDANDALTAKVKELTAASTSDYQRVQAIGQYVQNIKYVAIEINLARGGGYQPHLATDVFARQYGDCKDKANLMRAMLHVAGIPSYLVNIYAGDRDHVQPAWPSPYQFNHAIIAVQLKDDIAAQGTLIHPVLGRLLFFDPSDTGTPLGDLPDYEQGSFALLIAGKQGDIVRVPTGPPESNRTDIAITGVLSDNGAFEAKLQDQARGQSAAEVRRVYAAVSQAEFQKQLEAWLTASAKEISLSKWDVKDAFQTEQFGLNMAFQAPHYAQIMQGRLLIFRPAIVERWNGIRIQSRPRMTPVVLNGECYHKQVRLTLPSNFTVDEMPDAASFSTPFGKFTATYQMHNGELLFTEELDVSATTIPAERYAEVKDFFEHVAGAEDAPVVMVRN